MFESVRSYFLLLNIVLFGVLLFFFSSLSCLRSLSSYLILFHVVYCVLVLGFVNFFWECNEVSIMNWWFSCLICLVVVVLVDSLGFFDGVL